jgi:hypothetical protein
MMSIVCGPSERGPKVIEKSFDIHLIGKGGAKITCLDFWSTVISIERWLTKPSQLPFTEN